MKRIMITLMPVIILVCVYAIDGFAKEEYAERTEKGCSFCHQSPNGGPLNAVGLAYVRNGYRYPIPERILDKAQQIGRPLHRALRLALGYIHLVAACVFVGSMFFVHMFVKPSNITGGIPRGERRLGLACMATLLATGIYLTWYRVDRFSSLFQSHFGLLLFVKMVLFALLLGSALVAVTVIHRRMGREARAKLAAGADSGEVTLDTLHRYDGKDGRPGYVLYKNTVYDVTDSPRWREGQHFGKHVAGTDLTKSLGSAPHGEEVLAGLPVAVSLLEPQSRGKDLSPTRRVFVVLAYANMILTFLILLCVSSWLWGFPIPVAPPVEGSPASGRTCLDCHKSNRPGIYHDWHRSIHAKVGVSCEACHAGYDKTDPTVSTSHLSNLPTPISALVTPRRCRGCHQDEVEQYTKSKHAHTRKIIVSIDKWLQHGMNNRIERSSGCFACHGSAVEFGDGRPLEGTWPNVGVGRVNPDGSLGSCTSCHTRHRFSLVEARKPEACDQCHLGPDHPQIEIYNESKHGTIYHAEGDSWHWRTDDFRWLAGRDYRSPTCASCHMSEAEGVTKTHDVTERLSWELQAPLTVRPEDFRPFPAQTTWQVEREKMESVCNQCHSTEWVSGHFANLDKAVENYNENYYRPVESIITGLYSDGLLSQASYFDESLEWEFYEFWHHEGRRARMGAAMMAPDYAWWHGFYELKHRYVSLVEEAGRLREARHSKTYDDFPGKHE